MTMGSMRFLMRADVRERLAGAESAYIAGLGPAGLAYLMECVCLGIPMVRVSGNQEARRRLAGELGAKEVFKPEDRPAEILSQRGASVDLAIDTTGSDVGGDFLRVLRRGGVVVPFGVGYDWRPRRDELAARDIIMADGGQAEALKAGLMVVDWLIEGKMPLDRMITRVISLDGLADAFEAIERREEIKVVVKF
jgi:alcohol dehydrogenase